jgi:energy-coupling factor transporter ATP-binding protein EcfA2
MKRYYLLLSALLTQTTPVLSYDWENDEAPPQQNRRVVEQRQPRQPEIAGGLDLPNHQGNEVVYIEPFAIGNNPHQQRDAHISSYQFERLLESTECLQGRDGGGLIYCKGERVYLPHITQESWKKEGVSIGFYIASYKETRRLDFIHQARLNNRFEEGLYQLSSVQETGNGRLEKWTRLGENPHIVEVTTPIGVSSIPGMVTHAPYIVPNEKAVPEFALFQNRIAETLLLTQGDGSLYNDMERPRVIVLGRTGSGKSTLMHALAGKELRAKKKERGGIGLVAVDPLANIHIGQGLKRGTDIATPWLDEKNNVVYWDCLGFGDPGGPGEDLINGEVLKDLFNHPQVKVILVEEYSSLEGNRSTEFINRLKQLTDLVPEEQIHKLNESLAVVFTKQFLDHPLELIEGLSSEEGQAETKNIISPKVSNLIQDLARHGNRVSFLPRATHEGDYQFDRDALLKCVHIEENATLNRPHINVATSPATRELAAQYGEDLNSYISSYLRTEGTRLVQNFCRTMIDNHSNSSVELRKRFSDIVRSLSQLRDASNPQDPEHFLTTYKECFSQSFDTQDLRTAIDSLNFLKRIRKDIPFHVGEWAQALGEMINKVQVLTRPPEFIVEEGVMRVQGLYVGMTDVNTKLEELKKSFSHIYVHSLNTFFGDANLTSHGTSLNIIAPKWNIVKGITFDLSGLPGAPGADGSSPGADGQPGKPGLPGGHFYGKIFGDDPNNAVGLKLLSVNSDGGHGGSGGKGADGADGTPGKDGDIKKVTETIHAAEDRGRANFEWWQDTH